MTALPTAPDRARRFARLPLLLLLLQIAISWAALDRVGLLEPVMVPDSRSYQHASLLSTVTQALKMHRTQGYPLFLRAMRQITGTPYPEPMPEAHAAIFFTGVLLFWVAVRGWTGSGWLALAAATPLTWPPVFGILPRIQPDFPSAGLALMIAATLLWLARRPGRWLPWLLLTLLVFLIYQTRPAYLFLVPLVPVVGWILRLCREGRPRWGQVRWAAGLAVATLLPLLLFSATRRAMVGDFGLVSFTGFNLIGVTASMLDEEVIAGLPPENQELAGRIFAHRSRWRWRPMTLDSDIWVFHEQWNPNTWKVSINPARRREKVKAREALERGEERRSRDIEVNDTLLTISRETIRQRPRLYLKWVRDSAVTGVVKLLGYRWVLWPLVALAVSLAIAWRRRRLGHLLDLRLLGLVLLCGSFTAAQLLLVILVSAPHYRYMVSIALLLPSALCALLFALWAPALRIK